MTEDRSNSADRSASFSPPSDPDQEQSWGPEAPPEAPSSRGGRSALAVEMARMWVQEHQEAAMLGAFAVGVVVGSLLRD